MSLKMTKEQARQFVKRWALVNECERKELRAATPQHKFHQLAALMRSVKFFRADKKRASEFSALRKRWSLLRRRLND